MSLADQMLAAGCLPQLNAIHGEPITILTGKLAGKIFTGRIEVLPDLEILTDLTKDPRARRRLSIGDPSITIHDGDYVQTSDGRKWSAVYNPQDSYLEKDLTLLEITDKDT